MNKAILGRVHVTGTKILPRHASIYRLFGASHNLSLGIPKYWLSSSRSRENTQPDHGVRAEKGRKGCPKETGPERPSHSSSQLLALNHSQKDPHP